MTQTLTSGLAHGLIEGMSAKDYHADPCVTPSLSSSLARVLLEKSPAHAARLHPKLGGASSEETPAMSTGTLMHAILAGSNEIEAAPFSDFKTKAAREWRDGVIATGGIPVLEGAYKEAHAIAHAVRTRAAIGIDNTPFVPTAKHEVSAIWQEKGCTCRARFDCLNITEHNADIWDWKTTNDATDRGIERSIARYRYDIQAAFYLRGLETLMPGYRGRTSFIFVFVESSAPYAVRRVVLQPSYLAAAQKKVSEAIDIWSRCLATNEFPLPSPDTLAVELPAWLDDLDDEISAS